MTVTAINSNIMAQQNNNPAAQDPNISKNMRAFLKALNSGGGKPLEQMTPQEARQVLIDAQRSVSYTYSDIEESERTITEWWTNCKNTYRKTKRCKI